MSYKEHSKTSQKTDTPFFCSETNSIQIGVTPTKGYAFIWPTDMPEKIPGTNLIIPQSIREEYRDEAGIVLACGSDVTDFKVGDLVIYDKQIIWDTDVKCFDGNTYKVKYMGKYDIKAVVPYWPLNIEDIDQLQLTWDRVLVKKNDPTEKIGNIFIPKNDNTCYNRLEVMAVSKQVTDIEKGDIVEIDAKRMIPVQIGEETVLLIRENQVLLKYV